MTKPGVGLGCLILNGLETQLMPWRTHPTSRKPLLPPVPSTAQAVKAKLRNKEQANTLLYNQQTLLTNASLDVLHGCVVRVFVSFYFK